jgi:hypothetical protein
LASHAEPVYEPPEKPAAEPYMPAEFDPHVDVEAELDVTLTVVQAKFDVCPFDRRHAFLDGIRDACERLRIYADEPPPFEDE